MCCSLSCRLLYSDDNHVEDEETLLNRQSFLQRIVVKSY
jgi:hypothetical protein